ncbi:MAG TPA: PQQ-binding-like beta-propeller repeat protein [Acidobacteriota bacterium]|nr:PQQ-binding-like beta-propeller repeat protein [Acidobacteriota bacterium]
MTIRVTILLAVFAMLFVPVGQAQGVLQWPMPGHDPQRTSRADEGNLRQPTKPLWFRNFNIEGKGYIPSRTSLVTVAGATSQDDLILVASSNGLHALRAVDGKDTWVYSTEMPVGNAPTVVGGVAYFGCFDKTIHAVNIATGTRKWQTLQAGAGFDTNPLVINGTVYAGNRDGYFYAFNADNGSLKWSFKAGERVSFSAAASSDNSIIYFASKDGYGYALDAATGNLVWRSKAISGDRFPGDGFYSFWPVVAGNYVFFPGSQNHFRGTLAELDALEVEFPPGVKEHDPIGPVDSEGWIDARRILDYLALHPIRRTFFVVDRVTGKEAFLAPILWVGNSSGNRYPPAIGPDGQVYSVNVWKYDEKWLSGRVSGWLTGTAKIRETGVHFDSADENGAISVIGDKLFYNHKGAQSSKYVDLASGHETGFWSGLSGIFPEFDAGWSGRRYGDEYANSPNSSATHGNVNPPVPIRDKICFHSSGSVLCFGEQ